MVLSWKLIVLHAYGQNGRLFLFLFFFPDAGVIPPDLSIGRFHNYQV